jgi:hypothetical protein
MKKNILLIASTAFITILLASSCKKPLGKCEEFFEKGCVVTNEYIPVCGCNDKTYANKSFAECAGVEYVNGSCD